VYIQQVVNLSALKTYWNRKRAFVWGHFFN
jgi:hypothetical protein